MEKNIAISAVVTIHVRDGRHDEQVENLIRQ
jgi:hypothetical protein